jgi:hypothetical protein
MTDAQEVSNVVPNDKSTIKIRRLTDIICFPTFRWLKDQNHCSNDTQKNSQPKPFMTVKPFSLSNVCRKKTKK